VGHGGAALVDTLVLVPGWYRNGFIRSSLPFGMPDVNYRPVI